MYSSAIENVTFTSQIVDFNQINLMPKIKLKCKQFFVLFIFSMFTSDRILIGEFCVDNACVRCIQIQSGKALCLQLFLYVHL